MQLSNILVISYHLYSTPIFASGDHVKPEIKMVPLNLRPLRWHAPVNATFCNNAQRSAMPCADSLGTRS